MDFDLLISAGKLVDGTGAPARRADVGVQAGRVAAIGDLRSSSAGQLLSAEGLTVCPGFIDHHQHADVTPLVDGRCLSSLAQGVTTIVVGNCGHGVAPGADPRVAQSALIGFRETWGLTLQFDSAAGYLEALQGARPAIHLAALAAHGAIRLAVMGPEPRAATADEMRRMEAIVEEAMNAGALGLSSGLEYSPGEHADQAELIRLARVAGRYGGVYASHVRNRTRRFVEAIEEAVAIAEAGGTRLALSHLAPRPGTPVEITERVHRVIESARERGLRVVVDVFPDPYGPGGLAACLPHELMEGATAGVLSRLASPTVQQAVSEAFDRRDNFLFQAVGPETTRLVASLAHPELLGLNLAEIGEVWGVSMGAAACRLLADEGADFPNVIISHPFATPEELDRLYRDAMCAFESDGIVTCPDGPLATLTMNRSTYGYTARVLQELVRERRLLSLEEAVRRMTALPADAVGLDDRGRIAPGLLADLVIVDPAGVRDRSTDLDMAVSPDGISAVVVGGQVAWESDRPTRARAGRVVRLAGRTTLRARKPASRGPGRIVGRSGCG